MKAENNKILKEKKNWILLLFKKLAKLIFNRIFYVAVAMLVQLGWILMMVLRLAAYSRYIDIGLRLIGIVLVLWILNKEINPSYKLAWTMLILILPILGVVLYFVFGRSRIAGEQGVSAGSATDEAEAGGSGSLGFKSVQIYFGCFQISGP